MAGPATEWHELIPALQRFYRAGDPLYWLQMPIAVLRSFAEAMPGIEARESLRRVSEIAVGNGSLRPQQARRIIRDWQREAAHSYSAPEAHRPASADQMRAMLSTAGISMVDRSSE